MDGKLTGLQSLVDFMATAKRRLKPGQRVVLEHTEDTHSEIYLNRHGEPVIMGINKCTFEWHRGNKCTSL